VGRQFAVGIPLATAGALLSARRHRPRWLDVGLLPEGPERTVLAMLLEREGEWDARGFLASLGDAELARAASRAMAEEQRRAEAIKETSVGERLEAYILYLQRKELKAQQTPVPTDDDGLREYARRLREQDRRLARPD
jgi:hypothetical protein